MTTHLTDVETIIQTITVTDDVLAYLKVQCGNVDFSDFPRSYYSSLAFKYKLLYPYLLADDAVIVDVGGGLSGIGILLKKIYPKLQYHVLDGDLSDPKFPGVKGVPFNDFKTTRQFYIDNGVEPPILHNCNTRNLPDGIDLVFSFASWGFHFPLSTYEDIFPKIKPCGFCGAELRYPVNETMPGRMEHAQMTSYKKQWTVHVF